MVEWHHRLKGHGFGWTPGVGDGQGGLACCGSWCRKESDMTELLNWTELISQLNRIKNKIYVIIVMNWEIREFRRERQRNSSHANLKDAGLGVTLLMYVVYLERKNWNVENIGDKKKAISNSSCGAMWTRYLEHTSVFREVRFSRANHSTLWLEIVSNLTILLLRTFKGSFVWPDLYLWKITQEAVRRRTLRGVGLDAGRQVSGPAAIQLINDKGWTRTTTVC